MNLEALVLLLWAYFGLAEYPDYHRTFGPFGLVPWVIIMGLGVYIIFGMGITVEIK